MGHQRQAKVVENALLEHLLGFSPSQALLLQDFIEGVRTRVVRVENEELALSQLPGVVEAHDAVGILSAPVHDGAPHFLEVLPEHLAVLDDVLPVSNVHDPAVIAAELLDHPGHFGRPDPLPASFQLFGTAQVDVVDDLLDLGEGRHHWDPAVVVEVEPGEESLEGSICAPPAMIAERLVPIVVVLIDPFGIVLDILLLLAGLDKQVRVEYFPGSKRYFYFGPFDAACGYFLDEVVSCLVYEICERFLIRKGVERKREDFVVLGLGIGARRAEVWNSPGFFCGPKK